MRSYSCSSMMLSTFSWNETRLLSTMAYPSRCPSVMRKSSSLAWRCCDVSRGTRALGLAPRTPPFGAALPARGPWFGGRFAAICDDGF